MDWISDIPKGLILIGIVVFSVVKHILEAKKNAEAEPTQEREDPFEGWEEPEQNLPPARPPRRVSVSLPPPLRSRAMPPPLRSGEPEVEVLLKRQKDMMERLQRIKETNQEKAVTTGGAAATRNRLSGSKADKLSGPNGLREMLRDPAHTRRAIVLREILSPPIGLR